MSCCAHAELYVDGMQFYGVPNIPAKIDLKIQRDLSERYFFQQITLGVETSYSETIDYGASVAKGHTIKHQWYEPGVVLRKKAAWHVLGLSMNGKLNQISDNHYPIFGGSAFAYLFIGRLKFMTIDYSTIQPITWSDDYISRGVYNNLLSTFGQIEPNRRVTEIIFSGSAAEVKQESKRLLGHKLESGVRAGIGLPLIIVKLGGFIERDYYYTSC